MAARPKDALGNVAVTSSVEVLVRRAVPLLVLIATLTFAPHAGAQVITAMIDSRAANAAWLAGAIGGAQGVGITTQGAIWAAHGPLAIGYQASRADNFAGTSWQQRVFLAGVRIPFDRAALQLSAGPGTVTVCDSNGEQSGTCTRTDHRQTVFNFTLGLAFSRYVGAHVGYTGVWDGDRPFRATVIGLDIGKLR